MTLSIASELAPVGGGFIIGGIARYASLRRHRWIYAVCVLLIALCATIGSGEFRLSWGFLADDFMLASLSACAGFFLAGWMIRRRMSRQELK